jgi:hypothetical protein
MKGTFSAKSVIFDVTAKYDGLCIDFADKMNGVDADKKVNRQRRPFFPGDLFFHPE